MCCVYVMRATSAVQLNQGVTDRICIHRTEITCSPQLAGFNFQCRKTKTEFITYQLEYSANLKLY